MKLVKLQIFTSKGYSFVVLLTCIFSVSIISAQKILIDNTLTEQQLIEQHLVEGCVEVSNITSTVNGSVNGFSSFGYFERDLSNFPFENGIVLSTGNATSGGNTTNDNVLNDGELSWGADPDLEAAIGITDTHNATTIEFDFVSISNLIQFNYILASEEYFGNFPCNYSDGFAFLIRQAGTTDPYTNIALIPGTTIPVNTQTIRNEIVGFCPAENDQYFDGYSIGDTNYNGRTTVLTASANITPNVQYHIKLVIADFDDENYDSAVFIQGNSFNPTVDLGPDVTTCALEYSLDGDIENPLANYSWYRNEVLINGETDPTLTVTQSGNYRIEISIPLNGTDCIIEDTVEVTLNSEQAAEPLADIEVCDDLSNDGIEIFDLSFKDAEVLTIMPPSNYNISYHLSENDAQNATNTITNPIQNTSNPQTIYVRIEDTDSGCLAYTTFNLVVNALPDIVTPTPQSFCDDVVVDGSTVIDLESYYDTITQGNSDYAVSYHYSQSDADQSINAIPLPYVNTNPTETIYVRVVNTTTGCISTTSFTIEVLELPYVSNLDLPPLDACEQDDDGFEFFDLTEVIPGILAEVPGSLISFHETLEDAADGVNAIADETNYENIEPNVQTIFIRIEDPNTGCASVIPLDLHTNSLITATNIHNFYNCDDASGDGISEFDLEFIAITILNNLNDTTIAFYETEEDMENNTNPIDQSVPYEVVSSPHTIYLEVEGLDCSYQASIDLIINPPVVFEPIPQIEYCDTDNDTFTSIELADLDSYVLNGQDNMEVHYFLTEADAISNVNALPPFYTNTANPTTFYVRIRDINTGCADTGSIELNVIVAPSVMPTNDIIICDNDQDAFSIVNLEAIIPEMVTSTTNMTISFHTSTDDADTNTNAIVSPSNYNATTEIVYARVESDITGCYAVVPTNIYVNTQPEFVPISNFENCETDGNATAEFIFNEKDNEILNGQTGKEVLYFETEADAINRANVIDKNVVYTNTSSPQTIFVRVENLTDPSCFGTSSFDLEVGSIPVFNAPTNFIVCDDISNDELHTFDFTQKINEISQGSPENLSISFHESYDDAQNQLNTIGPEYTNIENPQQIYARIENGTNCHAIVEFGLNVVQVPTVNLPSAIEQCDTDYDGITTFDLTVSEFEILDVRNDNIIVTYFENQDDLITDQNEITNPESYSNTSNPQTMYVKVLNVVSNCYAELPLDLVVNLPPAINNIPEIHICENESTTYDLDEATAILVEDSTNVDIAYYSNQSDAENQINPLGPNYIYSSSNDIIFIRAENTITNCVRIQSFNLTVNANPVAHQAQDLEDCDDDYDGQLYFQLQTQTPQILGNQSELAYTVTYHLTFDDAEDGANVIQDLNFLAFDAQEIFARVENNETGCYDTSTFFIYVNRKPEIVIEDQVMCLDNLPLTVSADTGFDDIYLWSTGETTSSIDINSIGTYWVTVTSIHGCETTSQFNVTESEIATVEFTETIDFSDPNNITITVSGDGDYLYILDDGIPQTSNVFENVSLGYHTITVIDQNGCGSVTTEVLVIDAPKFMTPNGDGYFDTWHIVGVETLPGTTIHIYDRYGKQLHHLTSTSEGWDGLYNGQKMPATDYWFVANVVQGDRSFQVKGHFAIRR